MRIRSAVLFGIPALALGVLGGWWFAAFVFLAVAVAAGEVVELMKLNGLKPSRLATLAWVALAFSAVRIPGAPVALLFSTLLLFTLAWQMRHRAGLPIANWSIALGSGAYLGWAGGCLSATRELPDGLWWLALAVILTWLADTGAYFTGRRFGKHKLAPALSPKKTWEGYAGGLACAALGGLAISALSPIGFPHAFIAGVLVGSLGTLGDLVESMFKRQANAKDSGYSIPGHGGVFDRIDSLLWAGVITLLYATLIFPR